jgi:hypothetical protein
VFGYFGCKYMLVELETGFMSDFKRLRKVERMDVSHYLVMVARYYGFLYKSEY